MSITIGIPVHNALECTLKCIDCIILNTKEADIDYQLIIMDDQSKPEVHTALEKRLSEIPNSLLLNTKDYTNLPNPNLGLAFNIMLDHVRSEDEFYWNVESDVYPESGCLVELIKTFRENPLISAVQGRHLAATNINPFYGRTKWSHMCCLLIPGAHARDTRIRVEVPPMRLWFCDADYGHCLTSVTTYDIMESVNGFYQHDKSQSSNEVPDGHFPGTMSFQDAASYVFNKWGSI